MLPSPSWPGSSRPSTRLRFRPIRSFSGSLTTPPNALAFGWDDRDKPGHDGRRLSGIDLSFGKTRSVLPYLHEHSTIPFGFAVARWFHAYG